MEVTGFELVKTDMKSDPEHSCTGVTKYTRPRKQTAVKQHAWLGAPSWKLCGS